MNQSTSIIIFIAIFTVILGLIPATIASKKGKNFWFWWIMGCVSFIIALPVAIFMESTEGKVE